MPDKSRFDQSGQTVYGPQTNVAGDIIYEQLAALPVPHQIPSPPPDFTGRDEELQGILNSFDKGVTITGLRGMGGIGKTSLAFRLAELLRDRYPDGQLMVNLQGTGEKPLTPVDVMSQIIRSYLPTTRLPEAEAELANLYRSVLDGKRILVLLDNALDDRLIRPLLPPARCGVIVTSRRKFTLPGLVAKDLDILKPDRAVELLLKVARPSSPSALPHEEKYWNKIASLCGFLPLALRAAGSMLANSSDLSLTKFAEELRDERQRLGRIGKEGVDLDVGTSFGLSYNRLVPETAGVFGALSVFPADFDDAAEEAICQDEGHRHLSELVRWSLVEYQRAEAEGEGRYHLHDLVRIFAAGQLEAADQVDVQQRHAAYYQSVLWRANELFLQGGKSLRMGLNLFDSEEMNIRSGQSWAKANSAVSFEIAEICSNFAWTGSILNLRLHPQDYMGWLEAASACARQAGNREADSVHMGNLGLACAALGDARKAIEYYEQALAIASEIDNRWDEGTWFRNLGNAYYDLGDTRKAIEYYEQALAIAREIGDRKGEGNALGNLGLAYYALGDAKKAIEYHEQHLAIVYEIGDRRGEGNDLGNLGTAYCVLGDVRKAIEYYEKALAIAREIGDRRNEGAWLGAQGIVYYALGDARKAIEYYGQALAIAREIGDHKNEGGLLGSLGLAYYVLGDARKAIEYHDQALAIDREIGNKRGEGNALGNLGLAYTALGDACKAIKYHDQALAIDREIGDLRGESADLGHLGLAYAYLNETRKAIEYYDQALAIARKIGDRRNKGAWLGNLGNAYAALGDARKAIEYYEQALAIAQGIGDRRGEGNALFNMSLSLDKLGQREKAVDLAKSALEIYKQIESPNAEWARKLLTQWQGAEKPI